MAAAPLDSVTALITGASRGIGAEVARHIAAAGGSTILLARSRARLEDLTSELGPKAMPIACDVGDPSQIAKVVGEIAERTGGAPDVIVNNAGVFRMAPLESTPPEMFIEAVQVNLVAAFLIVNAFLASMRSRGSGHVVTIGSVADRTIFPDNAAYAASKYGLRAMHEVCRAEMRGTGVRVTLVSPAAVDTDIWEPVDTGAGRSRESNRASRLEVASVAAAVMFALTQPPAVNVDELRLSRS